MKVATILGARPQFIKAGAVSREIDRQKASGADIQEIILHTGQHFDANMSDVFFTELNLRKPMYNFEIHGGNHGEMTGRMLIEIEKVLLQEIPDVVMVYGDTNSTLAGALAAAKLHIPVAHVEAGLRSFNMAMPEEINRILTDKLSHWLFTPTNAAICHLQKEDVDPGKIVLVGDVMFDVALHHSSKIIPESGLLKEIKKSFRLNIQKYCLATVHRAENTDHPERLSAIVDALSAFSKEMPVIWPLHPRTKNILAKLGKLKKLEDDVILIEPVGYLDMVQLEKYAGLIATDSGGVQKEAFFYRKPCVTLRDETEWIELVEAGWNRLAPPISSRNILSTLQASVGSSGQEIMPYGKGDAAKQIVQRILEDIL